jgi:putative endonuclease
MMKKRKYLYVYILKCADGLYYTGVTNNPARRLLEHNDGRSETAFTFSRRPVEMLFCKQFEDFLLAIAWEKRIKKWSQKKKEALINGDFEQLKVLAKCLNESSHENYVQSFLGSARNDCSSARND